MGQSGELTCLIDAYGAKHSLYALAVELEHRSDDVGDQRSVDRVKGGQCMRLVNVAYRV
jgi:hypothetical protein